KLTNYGRDETICIPLSILIAADFLDSDEAGQGNRQQAAPVGVEWDARQRRLRFRYCHERLDRIAEIRIEATDAKFDFEDGALKTDIELNSRASAGFAIVVEPIFDTIPAPAPPAVFKQETIGLPAVGKELHEEM